MLRLSRFDASDSPKARRCVESTKVTDLRHNQTVALREHCLLWLPHGVIASSAPSPHGPGDTYASPFRFIATRHARSTPYSDGAATAIVTAMTASRRASAKLFKALHPSFGYQMSHSTVPNMHYTQQPVSRRCVTTMQCTLTREV